MVNSDQVPTVRYKKQCLMTSQSSHTIANGSRGAVAAPTIKVVHIFNPTVIKTDAAHFRALVQELTGRNYKPRGHDLRHKAQKASRKEYQLQQQEVHLSLVKHSEELSSHGTHTLQQQSQQGSFNSFADSVLNIPLSESSESENSEQRTPLLDVNYANSYDQSRGSLLESSVSEYSDKKASILEVNSANRDQKALQIWNLTERPEVFDELVDMEPLPYEHGGSPSFVVWPWRTWKKGESGDHAADTGGDELEILHILENVHDHARQTRNAFSVGMRLEPKLTPGESSL